MTPGENGSIYLLNKQTGAVISVSPLANAVGSDRRSLVWNGKSYVQGVVEKVPGAQYPSELDHILPGTPALVFEGIPVVTPSGGAVSFYGIAVDMSDPADLAYYATDTAGNIYRFRGRIFSGVRSDREREEVARNAAIRGISPNPLRGDGTVTLALRQPGTVTVDLLTVNGERVARIFDGRLDAGDHPLRISTTRVHSGVYYLTITTTSGERDVMPVVVIK